MHINETIINAVLSTLGENGKWMTANEIIAYASSKGLLESKNAPRQAMSHPVYRVLTSMMRTDESKVNGLERRIRKSGDGAGSYEYAYKGLYNGTKVLVNGVAMTPASGETVVIGGKKYSVKWLEEHPDKWKSIVEESERRKTILDAALQRVIDGRESVY